jgi:hypothetical protein
MSIFTRGLRAAVLTPIIVSATYGVGYPQVPTPEHFAACNAEAHRAVKAGKDSMDSAEPTAKDHSRAAEARSAKGENASTDARADDPQLAGMNAEGAKNPEYQAAYRICMRKSGF